MPYMSSQILHYPLSDVEGSMSSRLVKKFMSIEIAHHRSQTGGMLALRGSGRFLRPCFFHNSEVTPPVKHWWKKQILTTIK